MISCTGLSSIGLLCNRRCRYTTSKCVVDEKGAMASGLTEGIDLALVALHYVVRGGVCWGGSMGKARGCDSRLSVLPNSAGGRKSRERL
jgi:hypothetical protein